MSVLNDRDTYNLSGQQYIMVNGIRRKIPDNIRYKIDFQNQFTAAPEQQAEAERIMAEVRRKNEYVKSAFTARGRKRRNAENLDIMEALREIRKTRGKTSKRNEVGFFLRTKDGKTVFKCEPPNFKTPSPSHINPAHLNPQLLAEMLKERKDVVRVKQSVFSRLFD